MNCITNSDFEIDLQNFYKLCREAILKHNDIYSLALDKIYVISSWLNTIDNLDTSMILSNTIEIIKSLGENQDRVFYLSITTEITIILNNIFYFSSKSYKDFWINNTKLLYTYIVYPLLSYNFDEINQGEAKSISLEDYYHSFFNKMVEEATKHGIVMELKEYTLI